MNGEVCPISQTNEAGASSTTPHSEVVADPAECRRKASAARRRSSRARSWYPAPPVVRSVTVTWKPSAGRGRIPQCTVIVSPPCITSGTRGFVPFTSASHVHRPAARGRHPSARSKSMSTPASRRCNCWVQALPRSRRSAKQLVTIESGSKLQLDKRLPKEATRIVDRAAKPERRARRAHWKRRTILQQHHGPRPGHAPKSPVHSRSERAPARHRPVQPCVYCTSICPSM